MLSPIAQSTDVTVPAAGATIVVVVVLIARVHGGSL